ncbi:GAF domain-containing protein [Mycobacterium sp. PS03-16]|uniref:PP2C family protein-serine/threonine phosphatase n=1 Tax=Mycobacterium sp. PS03-16 TaxID=2559611 RepID=UPI001073B125|nr:GAF domain-containing SpoIIE family protein phosphatase [Mycobacterium sp. PS03-16]TFV54564.1 GAF domain-containing protein [Mycobacterium sp. PS03-16]
MIITQASAQSADDVEAQRLRAVGRYAILDSPADDAFDRIARVAARTFAAPMATISIVDRDRIWFKAAHGLDDLREVDRRRGFSSATILDDGPCVISDATSDPRTAGNPFVDGPMGVRFYAGAPIVTSDGYRIGAVNVLDTAPRDPAARDLATLADLAALAMDHLDLRLSTITSVRPGRAAPDSGGGDDATLEDYAEALQRSLLPPRLPNVPGLSLAAHYHPASAARVGGDFYDVFALDGDRWAFFLGDVEGHGTGAAAVTSLVRHTLRAAALHHDNPTDGLGELNVALVGDPNERRFCTVLFGTLTADPAGGHLVHLATGGHLPALLLDPVAGEVRPVRPAGGMFVGAIADATFDDCVFPLRPGQTLLLFTDGITEARPTGAGLFGEDGLSEYLRHRVGLRAADLIADLADLVPSLRPDDDIALLALTADR